MDFTWLLGYKFQNTYKQIESQLLCLIFLSNIVQLLKNLTKKLLSTAIQHQLKSSLSAKLLFDTSWKVDCISPAEI